MEKNTQTEVIEAEYTEVVESAPVAEETEATVENTDTAEAPTEEQAQPEPVFLLGRGRLVPESSQIVSVLVSYTLNVLGELGAQEKFEDMDTYLGFIKSKLTTLFYTILPTGAVAEIIAEHDAEAEQINVGVKLNTESELEVYSDRIQVPLFIKVK